MQPTSRRSFLKSSALTGAAAWLAPSALRSQPAPTSSHAMQKASALPNILLIHWHDLGRYLGCYGRAGVESPHLDQLASEGIRFTDAHCCSPLCTPARGALFTGLHPQSNGLLGLHLDGWRYRDGIKTLPELLAPHGYDTALIGLQHEHPNPAYVGFDHVHSTARNQFCADVAPLAAEWLLRRREQTRPFFASVGFFEVHRPVGGGDFISESPLPADPASAPLPFHLPDHPAIRRDAGGYYGCIKRTDTETGHILAALAEAGLADNTWVLFTTDHGCPFPGAKGSLTTAGTEVAALIRAPGRLPAGALYHSPFSHVDLIPTLLAGLGLPSPSHLQGVNHWPSLATPGTPPPADHVFTCKTTHDSYDPQRAVRTTHFNYIRRYQPRDGFSFPSDIRHSSSARALFEDGPPWYADPGEEQLYDLHADPTERTNLAAHPAHATTLADLRARLDRHLADTADPILSGPIPLPAGGRLWRTRQPASI